MPGVKDNHLWRGLVGSLPQPIEDERSQRPHLFRAGFLCLRSKGTHILVANVHVPHVECVVTGETAKSALCLTLLPKRARHPANTSASPPRQRLTLHSSQNIQHSLSRTPTPIPDIFQFCQRSKHVVDDPFLLLLSGSSLRPTLSSAGPRLQISGRKGRGHRRLHQK